MMLLRLRIRFPRLDSLLLRLDDWRHLRGHTEWTPTPEQQATLDAMSRGFASQGISLEEAQRRLERMFP